ncbi:MAG: ComF family protein [Proteobacteria bacterium]|nr:ComF family protein [Pseudomonadota bacterium]
MEIALKILSRLFPSRCILCQRTVYPDTDDAGSKMSGVEICPTCLSMLPFNHPCCVSCALPLAEDIGDDNLCGRCIQKLPAFDYSYSLFRYEADLIRLIHQLKFSEKISHARSIGILLLEKLRTEVSCQENLPDCLLPVPLHSRRMRQRGFNQSIEIARVIATGLQIPIISDAVIRHRSTQSQTGLSARQRKKNIRGAFDVLGNVVGDPASNLASNLAGKHVLIIDDVVTTGSTVNELAKLLKKHKVEKVGVLSIARAPIRS